MNNLLHALPMNPSGGTDSGLGHAHVPRGEPAVVLHRRLAALVDRRLRPQPDDILTPSSVRQESEDLWEEERFLSSERGAVSRLLDEVPLAPEPFGGWLQDTWATGPGQRDPLFPWLAAQASRSEMRWFLAQETAAEAIFPEVLALAQVGLPAPSRAVIASYLSDELGRGSSVGRHGALLGPVVLEMDAAFPAEDIVWESLALSNLMIGLAWNRRYAYQAVGALVATELTAPGRSSVLREGLGRLDVSPRAKDHIELLARLDAQHARPWWEELVRPLVMTSERIGRLVAEGVLLRLHAEARCYARYRRHFGFTGDEAMATPKADPSRCDPPAPMT
jgi:hypothetical protein